MGSYIRCSDSLQPVFAFASLKLSLVAPGSLVSLCSLRMSLNGFLSMKRLWMLIVNCPVGWFARTLPKAAVPKRMLRVNFRSMRCAHVSGCCNIQRQIIWRSLTWFCHSILQLHRCPLTTQLVQKWSLSNAGRKTVHPLDFQVCFVKKGSFWKIKSLRA